MHLPFEGSELDNCLLSGGPLPDTERQHSMFIRVGINGHGLSGDALQQMVKKSLSAAKRSGTPSVADMEERDAKQSRERALYHRDVCGWLSKKNRQTHPKNRIAPWKRAYLSLIRELCRYQKDYVIYQTA